MENDVEWSVIDAIGHDGTISFFPCLSYRAIDLSITILSERWMNTNVTDVVM